MSGWTRIWYWMNWFWGWMALDLRIMFLWSRLMRRVYESKYIGKPIHQFKDILELQRFMVDWMWRPDPFWVGWDMTSVPAAVEARASDSDKKNDDDCDGFAVYACEALNQIARDNNGSLSGNLVRNITMLTSLWAGPKDGDANGHCVCVFEYLVPGVGWRWAWVSNWYRCAIQWKTPNGSYIESLLQIVDIMCQAAGGAQSTRWAHYERDLKKVYKTGT